jgi:hypothetical protein
VKNPPGAIPPAIAVGAAAASVRGVTELTISGRGEPTSGIARLIGVVSSPEVVLPESPVGGTCQTTIGARGIDRGTSDSLAVDGSNESSSRGSSASTREKWGRERRETANEPRLAPGRVPARLLRSWSRSCTRTSFPASSLNDQIHTPCTIDVCVGVLLVPPAGYVLQEIRHRVTSKIGDTRRQNFGKIPFPSLIAWIPNGGRLRWPGRYRTANAAWKSPRNSASIMTASHVKQTDCYNEATARSAFP